MQAIAVPHPEVLTVQEQSGLHGNNPDSNQIEDMNAPRLNWEVILTCYKCGEKEHLP